MDYDKERERVRQNYKAERLAVLRKRRELVDKRTQPFTYLLTKPAPTSSSTKRSK